MINTGHQILSCKLRTLQQLAQKVPARDAFSNTTDSWAPKENGANLPVIVLIVTGNTTANSDASYPCD